MHDALVRHWLVKGYGCVSVCELYIHVHVHMYSVPMHVHAPYTLKFSRGFSFAKS